jgi:hypothetical protein
LKCASITWLAATDIMGNPKRIAAPYILAALLVAVAIWATMGSPQANLEPAKHRYAGPP